MFVLDVLIWRNEAQLIKFLNLIITFQTYKNLRAYLLTSNTLALPLYS